MIKASMMAALASKLEEEHITSPIDDKTVEAEVSASVEVSPEVQTQIDEAVTQAVDDVEAMTEASDDLEEVTEEAEDIEETTATLRAVVESIKENGGVIQPQLYAFLQKAGYLNLIGQLQSTAISKVTYPAVETMSTSALNKQYSDSILVGCEAAITEFGKSVWKRIRAIFEKIKEFFQKIYTYITANEKRVTAANQSLQNIDNSVDVKDIKYSPNNLTAENMQKIADAIKSLSSDLISKIQEFNKFSFSDKILMITLNSNETTVLSSLASMKLGGQDNLGDAGLTVNELKTNAYKNALECVKACKNLRPVLATLDKVIQQRADNFKAADDGQDNQNVNESLRKVAQEASELAKGTRVLYTSAWKVVNSYLTACSAVVKASSKKEEK